MQPNLTMVSRCEHFAICHTCHLRHECPNWNSYLDFLGRHVNHTVSYLQRDRLQELGAGRLAAWSPRRIVKSAFGKAAAWALRQAVGELGTLAYLTNDDVKQANQGSFQAMTVTHLHSLASSATAGWQSDSVDYSSNLYLDDIWQVFFDTANTAAASSKAFFIFAGHQFDGSTWTTPFTGSEGTCTYNDVTANAICPRTLGSVPYVTTNENPESAGMSMAATLNGCLPLAAVVGIINNAGAALSASGSTVGHRGVYATVI